MKQVSIVGLAPSWRWAPETGEVWGITGLISSRPVTRVIDMHDVRWNKEQWLHHYRAWIGKYKTENQMIQKAVFRWHGLQDELRKIKETNTPLYTIYEYPELPSSHAYPLKEIISHFDEDYFSSSFDFAIALAIYEGYERIDIYGANMSAKDEYVYQRPSFSYWLGICKGMGVTFKIHGETELLKNENNLIYGYNKNTEISCNDTRKPLRMIPLFHRVLTMGLIQRLLYKIETAISSVSPSLLEMFATTLRKVRMVRLLRLETRH